MSLTPVPTPCGCPVTKSLVVTFDDTAVPAQGYILKWATPLGAWNYVSPNVTDSPHTILNVPACEDITVVMQSQCENSQVSSEVSEIVTGDPLSLCGDTITASHTHNGLYAYPPYILDVRAATSQINISYDVIDKPNRIIVYDDNNNEVANSDWRGVASYPYTWGTSLNTPTTGIVNFTKTEGKCFYKILVLSYTDVSYQDSCTLNIACPTTTTPVIPTITYLDCPAGYGSYRINAPAGTVLKISLSAAGSLVNNSTTGSCARIDSTITSSTGPTSSAVSSVIPVSGTATVGANNGLFVSVTVPGSGAVVINTEVVVKNSNSEMTNGTLRIFEVNGSAADITQGVCLTEATATVSCGGTTNYQYSATMCSSGATVTVVTSSLSTVGVTYKASNSPVGECYTILSYNGFTNQTPTVTFYSTVSACGASGCSLQ